MNPIFIEYYSHESCDCYKVKLPWSKWREHKVVLCPVSDGIGKATEIAWKILTQHLADSLAESIMPNQEQKPA